VPKATNPNRPPKTSPGITAEWSKRHNTWVYVVRYRDPSGKQHEKRCVTLDAAKKHLAMQRADIARGGWRDPRAGDKAFAKYAAEWLDANPGKRSSSWARDETIIRLHLNPTLGDRALGSVTPTMVQALINKWATHYAPRTVKRHYETLRAIFAAAVENDYIARTPCRRINRPEITHETRHVITNDELALLARELPERYSLVPHLGVLLGLRWGEVAGLRVRGVDPLARTITVTEQRTRGAGGRAQEGAPKTHKSRRTLTIDQGLATAIARHLTGMGLTGADTDAYVFTMPGGGPLDHSRFRRKVWIPACVRAGLGHMVKDTDTGKTAYVGLSFHDLRRANATALVRLGVDVGTAQDRLGHADSRTTLDVYRQHAHDADRDAAELLAGHFANPGAGQMRGKRGGRTA
jgi:integrase